MGLPPAAWRAREGNGERKGKGNERPGSAPGGWRGYNRGPEAGVMVVLAAARRFEPGYVSFETLIPRGTPVRTANEAMRVQEVSGGVTVAVTW